MMFGGNGSPSLEARQQRSLSPQTVKSNNSGLSQLQPKSLLIKLFQKQATHHHRLNRTKTQLGMAAGVQSCFEMIDKAGEGRLTAQSLFMFTSNVFNEEQNALLFESVLTTQHSL